MIASGRVNVRRSDKTSFYLYGHPDLPVPPDQLWQLQLDGGPDLSGHGIAA